MRNKIHWQTISGFFSLVAFIQPKLPAKIYCVSDQSKPANRAKNKARYKIAFLFCGKIADCLQKVHQSMILSSSNGNQKGGIIRHGSKITGPCRYEIFTRWMWNNVRIGKIDWKIFASEYEIGEMRIYFPRFG